MGKTDEESANNNCVVSSSTCDSSNSQLPTPTTSTSTSPSNDEENLNLTLTQQQNQVGIGIHIVDDISENNQLQSEGISGSNLNSNGHDNNLLPICSKSSSSEKLNNAAAKAAKQRPRILSMSKSSSESNIHAIMCQNNNGFESLQSSFSSTDFDSTPQLNSMSLEEEGNFEKVYQINLNSSSAAAGGITDGSGSGSGSGSVIGPKYKLISEGQMQVCKVKHGKNLMGKLASSKLLRRWETHHLILEEKYIVSRTPTGSLLNPIPYWQMEEVYVVVRWDCGGRYVIRILIPDGSLLLQGSNAYVRDQWYHSIIWKKNIFKYQNLMRSSRRPEIILKELKSLVNFATTTPLHDDCISHVPIEIVSNLLDSGSDLLGASATEQVLVALSPLLEKSHPPPSLCRFFSLRCRTRPRCPLVHQLFTPVVRRALKHNVDFGKFPHLRQFIQDYIQALSCHNDGINVVRNFVKTMHGPASSCPHPKVMSNLVSVCLAALSPIFERNNAKKMSNLQNSETIKEMPWDEELLSYLAVFDTLSEFEDWRPGLAALLQPIPFPEDALSNPLFTRSMSSVIRRIGTDHRCEVHRMVMEIREGKESWFHLYSPSNLTCSDDSELWGLMLERLLSCCFRRKRFLTQLGGKLLGSCLFLALGREHGAAQEALSLLLEWQIVSSEDTRVQIATTLQSTPTGSANYDALCARQLHLRELQQKGGPRKLTLPSRSTDADLRQLLSCGSFGNLECLTLAFTGVTSASAEQLIKLPSLRYLNLWSTQFGDTGLQLISEHLTGLQVLNLCETPVTDQGILSLTNMKNLRKLNLNSTHLSPETFAKIKTELPDLKEIDIRYTDAW